MKVHVLEEAATELVEAIEYYEDLEPGLGVRLKSEVPGAPCHHPGGTG